MALGLNARSSNSVFDAKTAAERHQGAAFPTSNAAPPKLLTPASALFRTVPVHEGSARQTLNVPPMQNVTTHAPLRKYSPKPNGVWPKWLTALIVAVCTCTVLIVSSVLQKGAAPEEASSKQVRSWTLIKPTQRARWIQNLVFYQKPQQLPLC